MKRETSTVVESLGSLWGTLEGVAQDYCGGAYRRPPSDKQLAKHLGFVWSNSVRALDEQASLLKFIESAIVKEGFRAKVSDKTDLSHQYYNSKTGLTLSLALGRLGVSVNAQLV